MSKTYKSTNHKSKIHNNRTRGWKNEKPSYHQKQSCWNDVEKNAF